MNSRYSISLTICIMTALSVCGSRAAFGATPSDPCSLLTAAQVGAVLGVQVSNGNHVLRRLCEWSTLSSLAPSPKKLTITFESVQAFEYTKTKVGNGITKVPLSGLGDAAIQGTTPKLATTLTVKKGDLVFVIHVWGFPIDPGEHLDQVQAMERALAIKALANL